MITATTFSKTGSKAAEAVKLDDSVFGKEVTNHTLLKEAYLAYLANGRANLAKTKTRGDVSGGGKKPWKQKGTGRARFGSTRVPIWRGGGVALGPTGSENYTKKINIKAKRLAIRQALSLSAQENRVSVIESFKLASGKTSEMVTLLNKLGLNDKSVVIVVDTKTDDLLRATNNLPNVTVVQARYLNVYTVMNADNLLFTNSALAIVSEWLGGAA